MKLIPEAARQFGEKLKDKSLFQEENKEEWAKLFDAKMETLDTLANMLATTFEKRVQ